MYLLYASKEVLILRINFVIVIVTILPLNCQPLSAKYDSLCVLLGSPQYNALG